MRGKTVGTQAVRLGVGGSGSESCPLGGVGVGISGVEF
jgi:hypothetical protein